MDRLGRLRLGVDGGDRAAVVAAFAQRVGEREFAEERDAEWLDTMGDNRDESADSRAPAEARGLGDGVPLANIGGRAEFITFSLDGSSTWNPLTWFSAMRGERAWTTLRPALAETDSVVQAEE